MVSVVTGSGLGLVNTSRGVVGANGELGQASAGRAGERLTVNAANGNLVIQNQDGLLMGVGADIGLLRTYNSLGGWDGDNGDAWRLGYYRRIGNLTGTLNAAGSTLTRTDADGFESTYTWRDGRYVGTDGTGAYDSLVVSSGTVTWTDGDTGLTETYAETSAGQYRLTRITDPEGHAIQVAYDAQGLISSLSTWKAGATSADETLTLVYDGNRRLTQVSTSTRNTDGSLSTQTRVSYIYSDDSAGRLAGVVTDLSPEDNSTVDGRNYNVNYTYDSAGRVRTVTQTDGTALTIDYDDAGRVRRITDALGHATTFAYDTTTRQTTVTDALNQVARLSYDGAGHLSELSGTGFKTSFAYDADGNLLSSTNGLGQQTLFGYDSHGNLVRSTDATGRVLERGFDDANRQTTQTQYAQLGSSGVAQTTRYIYDTTGGLRRLRFSLSAEGRVTEHQYNSLGQVSSSVAYTRSNYTGAATLADLAAWASQQTGAQRQDFSYDLRGQLASRTDAAGLTRYTYDASGRLLQNIDANGNTTAYVYDGLDRLTLSTDALGVATVYTYDDAGYRTSVQWASRDGQSPGLRTVSTYNAAGLLVAQGQFNGSTALGETRYTYDADNRLRMTQDPTGQRQWMLYDEAGRLVGKVDALGHLDETRYDAAGRLVQTIGYEQPVNTALLLDAQGQPANVNLASIRPANSAADRRQWQIFDAAGRLTHQVNGLGEVTETQYDGAGRTTTVIQHGVRLAALPTAGSSDLPVLAYASAGDPDRITRSLYDADGLLRGTLDAEGYLTENRYDAAGHLVERIAYAAATDPAQRVAGGLAQLTPAAGSADRRSVWLYDSQGRVQAEIDPDGWLTETTYNAAGQRTQSLRYARRISGTAIPASTLATLRPASSPQDQATTWSYDALNRVQTETAADGTVTRYTYDNAGNLTRTDRALGTAEVRSRTTRYDVQGRIVAELSAEGTAKLAQATTQEQIDAVWSAYATQHAYDAAGRRIRSTDARGNTTVYYFDAAGRLAYAILKTERGGEVQASRSNGFGENTASIRYTRRLSLADTAPLAGGQADAALDAKVAALADSSDQRTQASYNQRGLIQQAIDALGFKTTSSYDAFGQLSRSEAEIGDGSVLRIDYSRDRRGLLTATVQDPQALAIQTRTEYDAFGRVTASVDARGYRSTTQYLASDGAPDSGRQVVLMDPTGARNITTYDAFDRVIRQTDALGHGTTFSHDTANRRVTMTTAEGIVTLTESTRHGQVAKVIDGTGAAITYNYDKNGNLLSRTDALGNVTSSSYDAVDNLATQSAAGTLTRYSYDAANRLLTRQVDPDGLNLRTTYEYDGQGRAVKVTDAAGTVTSYRFDAKGQLVETVVDDTTTGLKLRTTTTYDAQGRTLSVTEGAGTAAARTTEYRYDLLGRRVQEIVDPAGLKLTTGYEYDAAGNVVIKRDALGAITRYGYDELGRKLSESVDPSGLNLTTRYAYDSAGNLARVIDVAGNHTRYLYDADNRLRYTLDAEYDLSENVYDAAGRIVRTVRYAEKQAGISTQALANGTIANSFVWITQNAAADRVTRYVYDAAGRQTLSVDALGAVTETKYDAAGRVVQATQYANALPAGGAMQIWRRAGTNSSAERGVGSFKAGDVVTATLRFKAPANTSGMVFLGDAGGPDPYDNMAMSLIYGNDDWQTLQVSVTLKHDDQLWIYVYGDRDGAYADDSHSVLYDNVQVTSVQRGLVLKEDFSSPDSVAPWGISGQAQHVSRAPNEAYSDAALALRVQELPDPARDRVTRSVYDAAGRQRFTIDAEGYVSEQRYDAAGRVTATLRYDRRVKLSATPTEAELVGVTQSVTTQFTSGLEGFDGNAGVWETGRLKLISQPLANGSWASTRSARIMAAGSSFKFDLTPTELQQTLHAGVVSAPGSPYARLVALFDPDGRIRAQIYDAAIGNWAYTDLGTYTAGTTYTVEITTTETGGTLYVHAQGSARTNGYSYTYSTKPGESWTQAQLFFAAQTYPSVAGTTTAYVDNVEERAADAQVTRYVYDAAGRQTYSVDAAGAVIQFEYDAAGRVVARRELANQMPSGNGIKLGNTDGGWHAIYKHLGTFRAGDTVTATVRFKASPGWDGRIFLGDDVGADPYDNHVIALQPGNDGWQTLTVTRTMSHDDLMRVFIYNLTGSADPSAGVVYDELRVTSRLQGEVLAENFEAPDPASRGWSISAAVEPAAISLSQVGTQSQLASFLPTLLDPARDRSTRYAYDAAGRQTHVMDALGAVTEQRYDAAGRVVETVRHAKPIGRNLVNLPYAVDGRIQPATAQAAGLPAGETAYLATDRDGFVNDWFAVTEGEQIDLSVEALKEGQSPSSPFGIGLYYSVDGVQYNAFIRAAVLEPGRASGAIAGRLTIPAGIKYARVMIQLEGPWGQTGSRYFRNVEATRVNTAADPLTGKVDLATLVKQQLLSSAADQHTRTVYDAAGRPLQQIDAENYLTTNSYDAAGNLIATARYAGRVQRPEALSQSLVAIIRSGDPVPATGAYLVEDPSQTRRSSFEYTALNQRRRSVDAEGYAESSTFDAFGNTATTTNKLGGTAVFQYDRLGRLVQETLPVQARRADGTLVPVVTQHQYDSRGNRIQTIEAVGLPEQRTTQYRFDALNRLVQTIGMAYTAVDAAGNTSTVVPVDVNRYDAQGHVIEQIQHANLVNGTAVGGRRSLAWYDALGRKTAEASADGVLAEFGYDAAGNLLRQTIRATRLAALPATGSPPPSVAAGADDRTLRFSYDALGRKTQTRLDGAWTWADGQPVALAGPQTLTLDTLRYDAAGNVIQRIDARGNSSFSYYDGLNRKRLAIDAAGYATAWDYAVPGSTATQETRYARAVPLAYDAGTDPQALRNALAAQPEDPNERNRVTVFVLDRLDRVTSRQVQAVAYEHVQADGSRVARIANAMTLYAYDGLGHVTQIQERVAELADNVTNVWQTTDIAYDTLGRETSRQAPGYTDHEGQAVRPRSETEYDGLGRTQRFIQRGRDNSTEADDRITRYSYGVHGQLSELVDADGGITRNAYDALGNVSRQTRVAVRKSDGSTRDLVKTWQYDAAGRITVETDLDTGDNRQTRYNAFGEVAAKGLNGGWQEWAEYTTLGKVWKTNAGDGAVKFYLHDANGNTTREIRAGVSADGSGSTRDLSGLTLAAASGDATLLHSVSLYDKRNLLIRTLEPRISRQGSTITLSQQFTPLWVPQWGDLNVTSTAGGAYAQAGVGQGAAYTTVTTSSGSATQLGSGAPGILSDGVDGGAAPSSTPLLSAAVTKFAPLAFSPPGWVKSNSPASVKASLQIPANWPAGQYRVTETVGSTATVLTSTAVPSTVVGVGGGGAYGQRIELIEWLAPDQTWLTVAKVSFFKEIESEPGFKGAGFSSVSQWLPTKKLLLDTAAWGASSFTVIVDGQTANQSFLVASATSPLGDGSTWPPAGNRLVGFELASSTRPTLAAGTHTVQILGFAADGRLVAGRNYTVSGDDASTLTEVSGSAGQVYAGSSGTLWAQTTRNAAGALQTSVLRWDTGSSPSTSDWFRYRLVGSQAPWMPGTPSVAGGIDVAPGSGLPLADGTYEALILMGNGARYGRFTVSAGVVQVSDPLLRLLTYTPEQFVINGPVDAQGRGRVALRLGDNAKVFEVATDAQGRAVFDLATLRSFMEINNRWSVVSRSISYEGYIQYADGTREVTHSDRGTLRLGLDYDTGTSFGFSTDTIPEYRPEGLVTLPGASGSITIGVGSSTPITLPVDGSDWRVRRSGSNLVLNLGAWKPAWGAVEQSVSWQYTGTDGLVATGNFGVAYDGTVRTVGSVTQRTRQPVLPLTIPGAVTLQAFLVGANGAVPTQVPSGEITGTGPNFTWNASSRLGQTLRYEYTALDGAGQVVGRGRGQLVVDVSGAITHTPDAPIRTPALLRLAPPAGTTGLVVEARRAGTSDAFVTLPVQALEGNTRVYSVEGYVPGSGTTTLEYRFTASGSAGVLSKGSGQLSIQSNGSTSGSAIEEYRPVIVSFKIVGRNVPQAQLAVPGVGNLTLSGTWVPPVAPSDKSPGELGYTRFDWDAAAYGAASGVRTYDYTLTAQSASSATLQDELGRPLVQTGRIALDPTSARPVQLLQQIQTFTQDSEIVVSRSQSYNAFGEVVEERDDRVAERMQAMLGGRALTADEQAAARTTLRYNTLGKLVAKIDPQTSITLANGYTYRDRPTTSYGYDLLGRLATSTDANGNLTRQALLAGSQPGQERVAAQWHADGGVRSTAYDIFGEARRITDEENHVIQQGWDKLGRLVQVDRLGIKRVDGSGNAQAAATLGERYSYDQLGQRLTRTDALGQVMRTDYDGLGRIVGTRTANGFETRYQYQVATVTGLNGATAAGYKKTTYEADGRSSIDQIDYFGHTTWHRDLGGTEYTYNYDAAARLVRQTSTVHTGQSKGQDIRYTYYANGYIQSATDVSAGTRSEYGYDAAGNRVSEGYYQWDGSARIASYQNATITYDELNRVARVQDVNYFDIRYEYDAVGNRRLVDSVYWDGVAGLRNKQVYWYAYDQMNRFTVTKGTLSGARATSKTDTGTSVIAGTEGTTLGYDKLGQRRVADYTFKGALIHETYGYSQDGYLQTIAQGGTLKDVRVLDALGRTKEQHDKQSQTLTVSTYDADNRLLSQRYTDAKDGNKNNTTAYSYYTDTSNTGSSQAGAGALAKTVTTPDSGSATTTTYSYDYWDEAKQRSIVKSGVTTGSTTLSYNANGHLLSAFDAAAKLTTSYFNSANGLILKRERQQVNGSGVAKVGSHFYYYADGKRVGDVSDDPNDDPRVSYAEALARKAQDPQDKKDLYKNFKPVTSADFDQNYEPINDSYPGAVSGTYTVRGGETLQAVAQTLWGDGSQWYLIAEANGLIGLENLTEGQVLVIPNKVTNIHNNSGTVRPYSAGEAIGNIDPTLPAPPPPPKHGCGGLGMVLMIVVAVVVTVYTAGAAAGAMGATLTTAGGTVAASSVGAWTAGLGVLSGAGGFGAAALGAAAIGGAVGNIAGQGVAIASGLQDGFQWRQVGQAALGSAITAGIGSAAQAGGTLSALNGTQAWQAAGRAALSSGVNQALHGDWNWQEVMASAVGAGVGAAAGNALQGSFLGSVGSKLAAGFAGGVVGQWAGPGGRANYGSVFASTLGNVIGDSIADGISRPSEAQQRATNRSLLNAMEHQADPDSYTTPQAGSGLRLAQDMAATGRLRYGFDEPVPPADYRLVGDEEYARLPSARYATAQRGNTLESIAGGDRELMGRYIAGMGLRDPNMLQPGQALMANWDMSSGDAVALANRFYAADAQARAAAMGSVAQAASPLAQVLGYAQSYPALAREIDGYDQLVAAGLMTPQQAQDNLLASPRAYATLRSDYETPAVAPAGGPSLTPWDGVTRLSPREEYLAKMRGGLDAVRGDALHFRVAQSLPDAAALAVGDLAVARVAGLLGRAAAPVQGLMFGERAMLMSSLRAEMGVGLAADLPAMSGLAAEAVRIPGAIPVRFDKLLGKTGTPATVDAAIGGNPLSKLPDPYQGVRDASAYLKSMGVDRATRVQVLQSFDVSTMSVEAAGDNLFGLRFHDFGENARPLGSYLFETFTPQTSRAGLALPYEWNEMTGVKQWQVTPGTTYLRGIAAPQLDFGLQYTGGAEQMYILQPWKYGSLK